MKIAAISLAASSMIFSFGLSAFVPAQPGPVPVATSGPAMVEGKDGPILLGRMVVTATPLD